MDYIDLLKQFGLKATPQRLSVLKVLDQHTHPTMDELYNEIRRDYPSISLATVYKNVNTLTEEGLIVEVNSPGQKTKYDIYEKPHIHLVCSSCGHVEDVSVEASYLNEYQEKLELGIGNIIERLTVVASIKNCKHCGK